jgi:outer membrane biosynthesis protein TonB
MVSACGGATPEPAQPAQQPEPTAVPETVEPTEEPAEQPTEAPEEAPTEPPTEPPTEVPAEEPTEEPTEEPVAITGEALLQERCTECHALSPTTNAKKSAEEWERTVARMVGFGANLNNEEQVILVDYLARMYGP